MPKPLRITQTQVQTIERLLEKGKVVEVKIEHGEPVIVQIERKKIQYASEDKNSHDR
jgi:hypothetical protein